MLSSFTSSISSVVYLSEQMASAELVNIDGKYDSEDIIAKVSSISNFVTNVGMGLGALISNALLPIIGFNMTFILGGAVLSIFAVIYLLFCGFGPIDFSEKDSAEKDSAEKEGSKDGSEKEVSKDEKNRS